MAPSPTVRPPSALRAFLASEAAGGVLLMVAAAAALVLANGPLGPDYRALVQAETGPVLAPKLGAMTVQLWINDGLMAIFFLLVGLEIKREFVDGALASWDRRRLPLIAAAVGMALPAAIYLGLTRSEPGLAPGWAIPAATDIAFAIGVLALLGSRAPTALKLFLTTVAIADDMGAVAIIAIVYTETIDPAALAAAAAILAGMAAMNRLGMRAPFLYLIAAAFLWYAILLSGVHATIAGVLAAAAIPIVTTPGAPDSAGSPLHRLEHGIAPWVAFLIVPLFGFANAGVSIEGLGLADLLAPLPLGIAAGLFVGKQVGIFAAVRLSVAFGLARRPRGSTWLQVYGICALCGIGFTMSLFIGALAFADRPALIEAAKIGVLLGSLASALLGYSILRLAPLHPEHEAEELRQRAEIDQDGDVAGTEERSA
jgi:NhaA family Na+:H+ antiporter